METVQQGVAKLMMVEYEGVIFHYVYDPRTDITHFTWEDYKMEPATQCDFHFGSPEPSFMYQYTSWYEKEQERAKILAERKNNG